MTDYADLKRRLRLLADRASYEPHMHHAAVAAIATLEADVARKDAALRGLLAEFPPIAWDETHGSVSAIVRTETLRAASAALADQPAVTSSPR